MKATWAKKYTQTSEMLQMTWPVVQVPGRSKAASPETRDLGEKHEDGTVGVFTMCTEPCASSQCQPTLPAAQVTDWVGRWLHQLMSASLCPHSPQCWHQGPMNGVAMATRMKGMQKPNNRTSLLPRRIQLPCCYCWGWYYYLMDVYLVSKRGLILGCQYGTTPWRN